MASSGNGQAGIGPAWFAMVMHGEAPIRRGHYGTVSYASARPGLVRHDQVRYGLKRGG